jgi:hypothetical protein
MVLLVQQPGGIAAAGVEWRKEEYLVGQYCGL